jgi:hypothetical protein
MSSGDINPFTGMTPLGVAGTFPIRLPCNKLVLTTSGPRDFTMGSRGFAMTDDFETWGLAGYAARAGAGVAAGAGFPTWAGAGAGSDSTRAGAWAGVPGTWVPSSCKRLTGTGTGVSIGLSLGMCWAEFGVDILRKTSINQYTPPVKQEGVYVEPCVLRGAKGAYRRAHTRLQETDSSRSSRDSYTLYDSQQKVETDSVWGFGLDMVFNTWD